MADWKEFEIQCKDYLNEHFGDYARFIHEGKENSTVPDIRVITNSREEFYIEAKYSPAQCGQFVLLPDIVSRTFLYSARNDSMVNIYAQKIIDHMNEYFDEFKEAGTAGKDIVIDNGEKVFSNWIIQNYENKGVRYFITNNFIIFPIHRFGEYFNISAKYRIKRSGSSGVGKGRMLTVMDYINNENYSIQGVRAEGDKLFATSSIELHNQRFTLRGYEYMFSSRGVEYEIRQLSNTFNANVIFSVSLKPSIQGLNFEEFIRGLQ